MEKICLDLEAAIDFLRGETSTIEKLRYYADREEICISGFTFMHLLQIISKTDAVMAFANSVTVLPFCKRSAQIAATLFKELGEDGLKRSDSVLTAAICMANDAFLFSKTNSNFDGMKGLRKV